MAKNYIFVDKYRLYQLKKKESGGINILFLPGGPGMGSEYLYPFAKKLQIDASIYMGDFPGDGSNRNRDYINIDEWRSGLVSLVKYLDPCVIATHSFSGMLALTIPDLENILKGFIIINSAPNNKWMTLLNETSKKYKLPILIQEIAALYTNRTDHQLNRFFLANVPYLFAEHEIKKGEKLLELPSYNAYTKLWADQNFHASYESTWIPTILPTLLIGSHDDKLLPAKLFLDNTEWDRPNIDVLSLNNTGHFPWLSHFDRIEQSIVKLLSGLK